jgi:hypothetical protein
MRKMKVWIGEDNFTEVEVEEMNLIQRIQSIKNKDIKKISESEWSLGKVEGAKVGVDFLKREFWTVVGENKVSVGINEEEYEFLNKIVNDSDEK